MSAETNLLSRYLETTAQPSELRRFQSFVFFSWAVEAGRCHQEAKHKASLEKFKAAAEADRQSLVQEAGLQATALREKRRDLGTQMFEAHSERCRHVILRTWASLAAKSRFEVMSQHNSEEAALENKALMAKMQDSKCQAVNEIRLKLKEYGLGQIKEDACRYQQVVFRTWADLTAFAKQEIFHSQELSSRTSVLKSSQRNLNSLAQELSASYAKHLALFAWAHVTVVSRKEAAFEKRLETMNSDFTMERTTLQDHSHRSLSILSQKSQVMAYRVVRARLLRSLAAGFFWWVVAVRERKQEGAQKHRLLSIEAELSGELYRQRNEAKKTAIDLRKQRRAHGVAAVHASLDRRLQGVLHAWFSLARDAQREAVYQRQLDIAAAEASASCAVLRMESRRTQLELRHQKRKHALRAMAATSRHWQHAVIYAWSVIVAESRHDSFYLQQLGRAAAQAAACSAEAKRRAGKVQQTQQVLGREVGESRLWHLAQKVLNSWKAALFTSRGVAGAKQKDEELRLLSVRWGTSVSRNLEATVLSQVFSSWQMVSTVSKGSKQRCDALEADLAERSTCEEKLRSEVEAAGQLKANLEAELQAEKRRSAERLEEMEAKCRAAACEQAAELEAKHAGAVRQHTEATRALLAETEARHAEALRAETATAGAQLTLLRGEQAAELRKQAESLAANHAAQLRAQSEQARQQLLDAEARHAAELHALSSASEVRLTEVEANHAAALRAQVEEANARQAELLRLAEQHQAVLAATGTATATCSGLVDSETSGATTAEAVAAPAKSVSAEEAPRVVAETTAVKSTALRSAPPFRL
eukprot:TRINITY_DN25445_c0_g1_i1.p1 TRINITY_DN25445_c0_g1~~TRINITY_DN25445_c0_g1_i1.p1  ORF type:complete len:894 (+),score=218.46 TRINITY_DN25445_c0_g1_i1:232-2682(+)